MRIGKARTYETGWMSSAGSVETGETILHSLFTHMLLIIGSLLQYDTMLRCSISWNAASLGSKSKGICAVPLWYIAYNSGIQTFI